MMTLKRKRFVVFAAGFIAIFGALAFLAAPRSSNDSDVDLPIEQRSTGTTGEAYPADHDAGLFFAQLKQAILASTDPAERQALVDRAAERLRDLPPDAAAKRLETFLETGSDAEVGMPFRVGIGGNLRSHPTLRVAGLDWLGQIDPASASEYAKRIFAASASPDEWAVAIRNYGRLAEPDGDPFFRDTVRGMLTHPEWSKEPTFGYLEAFDAVVFNRQYEIIPDLVSLMRTETRLAPVVALALDELSQIDPAKALREILNYEAELNELPMLRSQLVARADVRRPEQRELIEAYLLDPGHGEDEKREFARLFPHFSRFVGHRLLSQTQTRSMADMARIDLAALEAVTDWLSDPRFTGLHPILRDTQTRLKENVASAVAGGFLPNP